MDKPVNDIAVIAKYHISKQMKRNRTILHEIIETIILCTKNELALRDGHDSGRLNFHPVVIQGNFKEILKYRCKRYPKFYDAVKISDN